ncbi:MAG: HD domain-containing protein [Candidatus Aenigmarchaeota archaeon]|nr:HD domain-containing protein [Candidatus Aenigmarchaeota archaeon]
MSAEDLEKLFDFLHKIENLKSTLRYNQTKTGRKESSAEHSWRLALTTFIVAEELKLSIDINRSIKIALVHDIAEAVTGDIDAVLIAEGKFSEKDKEKLEIKAIHQLQQILPEPIGKEILQLWTEYNDCVTKEAKFVKALDKIETLTQLAESGYKTYDKPQFIANYANKSVKDFPELLDMLRIVKRKLRKEFDKGNIPWYEEYNSLD